MKIGRKCRAPRPSPVLQGNLEAASAQFTADFLKSAPFQHAATKGEVRECPVRAFFREHLPSAFRVDKGEVIDLLGQCSPQVDVLISDKLRNFPLTDGTSVILPAEALLVVVEVKSVLTYSEIKTIFAAADKFKSLRPFRDPVVPRRTRGKIANDGARFFYCVFAYDSDLTMQDWGRKEFERFKTASSELDRSLSLVDRVYVDKRGLIDPGGQKGFEETNTNKTGLLQFYMHILGFLLRENARRQPVPYLEYSGRMVGGWRSYRPKAGQI